MASAHADEAEGIVTVGRVNAYKGPTPPPGTAVRYSPILGESFDPGGDSACPTSAWAATTTPGAPAAPGPAGPPP